MKNGEGGGGGELNLSKYCATQGHVTPRVLPPYDDSSKALFWLVCAYFTESIQSSSLAFTEMYSHILIQTQINHQHPRVRLRLPTPSSSDSTPESRAVLARLHKIGRRSCYKSAKIDRNFRLFWEILPVTNSIISTNYLIFWLQVRDTSLIRRLQQT